tara:strand:- start:74 stop:301 length:228 start_codon:yes stop_codon:yes gene_type:complete
MKTIFITPKIIRIFNDWDAFRDAQIPELSTEEHKRMCAEIVHLINESIIWKQIDTSLLEMKLKHGKEWLKWVNGL